MTFRSVASLVLAATLAVSAGVPVVRADDVGPEVAKRLLREGRIMSLPDILVEVRKQVPGEFLETELELEDGIYVYEIKLLRPDGRLQEIEADAATGKILKIEDDD